MLWQPALVVADASNDYIDCDRPKAGQRTHCERHGLLYRAAQGLQRLAQLGDHFNFQIEPITIFATRSLPV